MNAGSKLVLVAEDDRDILQLLTYRLEQAGYQVVCATDGQEALRLTVELEPDLAVLDVSMPRLDGFELTRELRRLESTRELPVILLSARANEADVLRGFEVGADDYVRKPFSAQELHMRIASVLGQSRGMLVREAAVSPAES